MRPAASQALETSAVASKQDIAHWWAAYPQTYGTVHGQPIYRSASGSFERLQPGTRDFFERVDQEFHGWNYPLHTEAGFFAKIFPYERYRGKSVLEIGCGLGTMAMDWARQGAQITALDLNAAAVGQTAQRFSLFRLNGVVAQADAHVLPFRENIFDYVYSWGVLHHSPDLPRSVAELFRVLRPRGGFGVMLYNRDSFLYRFSVLYLEGLLHAESRFLGPVQLASRYTDGGEQEGNPYTWPVTRREMRELFGGYAADLDIKVFGVDFDAHFRRLLPKLGAHLPAVMKKPWARRWGWSLWITGTKRA